MNMRRNTTSPHKRRKIQSKRQSEPQLFLPEDSSSEDGSTIGNEDESNKEKEIDVEEASATEEATEEANSATQEATASTQEVTISTIDTQVESTGISENEEAPVTSETGSFSITNERTQKKVPAKLIDALWDPLETPSLNAVENILYISMNRTLENLENTINSKEVSALTRKSTQKKYQDAKVSLTRNWLDSNDPKSFMSRLRMTKLPSKTVLVGGKRSESELDPMLMYDRLRRQRQVMETYLLAEMNQLHELERTYKKLETLYQLDSKYLNDYKRIVEVDTKRMATEITNNRQQLGVSGMADSSNSRSLSNKKLKGRSKSAFSPETDKDVQDILHLFQSKLVKDKAPHSLSELSQKIDKVFSILFKEGS